jgi:DNA gyrase subunit B
VVDEAVGQQAAGESFHAQELHEVREINKGIAALAPFGLNANDLVPQIRVAGREPALRLALGKHEDSTRLSDLRELAVDIRKLGEKGMTITRFKGLGEMDPEELWETTLDPAKRILMQVKLDDAAKADELFRTLMGEKVEPRRDFINKHALQVREIDWHGA